MKKIRSKILSSVLAVVMVLGMVPATSFSAETETHENHKVCVNSDVCGDNCTNNAHAAITDWQPLPTDDADLEGGHYYATASRDQDSITITGDVVLCFNGYEFKYSTIYVSSGATLKLCDCSKEKTGKILYDSVRLHRGSTFDMYSGTIEGGSELIRLSGGQDETPNNVTINIYGGLLKSDYTAIKLDWGSGTVNMAGGEIYVTGEYSDYQAIYVGATNWDLNFTGGTLRAPMCVGVDYKDKRITDTDISISGSPSFIGTNTTDKYKEIIKTVKTIKIEGSPRIEGGYVWAANQSAQDFVLFTLTGPLGKDAYIEVSCLSNEVITKDWSKYMPDADTDAEVAFYFSAWVDTYDKTYLDFYYEDGEVIAKATRDLSGIPSEYVKPQYKMTSVDFQIEKADNIGDVWIYRDSACTDPAENIVGTITHNGDKDTVTLSSADGSKPLPAGTYYIKVTTRNINDAYTKIVIKDGEKYDKIIIKGSNVYNLTNPTYSTLVYEMDNYNKYITNTSYFAIYDSIDAQEPNNNYYANMSGRTLYIYTKDAKNYPTTKKLYISYLGEGEKAPSDRTEVIGVGPGAAITITGAPEDSRFVYGQTYTLVATTEEQGDLTWSWTSSNNNAIRITPVEGSPNKATVEVLDVVSGVITITASYQTDGKTASAKKLCEVKGPSYTIKLNDVSIPAKGASVPFLSDFDVEVNGLMEGHQIDLSNGKIDCVRGEKTYASGSDIFTGEFTVTGIRDVVIKDANGNIVTNKYTAPTVEGGKITVATGTDPSGYIPTLSADAPYTIKMTNEQNYYVKLGVKIVHEDGTVVKDWHHRSLNASFNGGEYVYEDLKGGRYTVYFCDSGALIPNADGGYTLDENAAVATREIEVTIVPAPIMDDISVETRPSVIKVTNNTGKSLYIKVVDANNNIISDWDDVSNGRSAEFMPLDGGDYSMYFCYKDAMNWKTGEPTSLESVFALEGDTAVKVVEAVSEEDCYNENRTEYILDYECTKDLGNLKGIIVVSSALNKAQLFLNDAMDNYKLDTESIENLAAKYYSYDLVNWHKLPDSKSVEIVVVNSASTAVSPIHFGMFENMIYNFDVTFKELSVQQVHLGMGDSVLTIDGEVTTGIINQMGNLEILGKDKSASYTSTYVEVECGMDPEDVLNNQYGGKLTVKDLQNVVLGDDSEDNYNDEAVWVDDSINFSNIDKLVVVGTDRALYTSEGDIVFKDINTMNITADGSAIVAGGNVEFINVFGAITVADGNGAISSDGEIIVTHTKKFLVYSGSVETPDVLVLDGNKVDETDITNYFAIIKDNFILAQFIAELTAKLNDYKTFPVDNATTVEDVLAFIKEAVEAENEEGLTYSYGDNAVIITPAKDSTAGSIKVLVDFDYANPDDDADVQEGTLDTTIVIPLRVYVNEVIEDFAETAKKIFGTDGFVPITSANKEIFKDALDIIKVLLKEAHFACLDEEEQENILAYEEIFSSELALIEELEALLAEFREKDSAIPGKDKVTSANIDAIRAAFALAEKIDDEYDEHLTEEEKIDLRDKAFLLIEKFEIVEMIADMLEAAGEAFDALPLDNVVKSSDKEDVLAVLAMLDELLAKEGNLTAEEKTDVEDMKAKALAKDAIIEDIAKKIAEIEKTVGALPANNKVTSDEKDDVEAALALIEELLAKEGNLTTTEKENVEADKLVLDEKLAIIKAVAKKLQDARDAYALLPEDKVVKSMDEEDVKAVLAIVEDLLSENVVGNLTAKEKEEVEAMKVKLANKLAIIKEVADKIAAAEKIVATLPENSKVTSAEKDSMEDALEITKDLLANDGNLTETEKTKVEAMGASLEEKLAIVKEVAKKFNDAKDTFALLPEDGKVTSADKKAVEKLLALVDDLLSEKVVGNLTAAEKEEVEAMKVKVAVKAEIIKEVMDKLEDARDAYNLLPEDKVVKSVNKEAIKAVLDKVNDLLSKDVVGNLTAEEKAEVEAMKAALEKKLAIIDNVAKDLSDFVEKEAALPNVDTITSDDKSAVEGLRISINEFKNTYAGNLTEEQKAQVEILLANLEKRLNKIKELETKIDKIEDDVEAQPTYKDVTSENKENIKDVIGNIDEVLENNKDNLSEEEIKDLQDQKKELEDMVEFIEKIEKYEPVAGDFENTTDSEENDKKGNLVNKSEELITIIPLDKIEKQHVAKGEKVQVYLVVTDISETVSNDDKDLIDEAIGDKEVSAYIDLTLFKQIGDREASKVPNTNGMVQITVEVPADLLANNNAVPGKYQIVRVHEGETTIIDTVFDEATGTITFETDKFSTYALVYEIENVDNTPEVPDTGDTTNAMPIIMLVIGLGMVIAGLRRKFN